ncbi:MAG: hypothetical protein NVSMB1_11520 [Polyangiales bacterium]
MGSVVRVVRVAFPAPAAPASWECRGVGALPALARAQSLKIQDMPRRKQLGGGG